MASIFEEAGLKTPSASEASDGSLFSSAGFKLPASADNKESGADDVDANLLKIYAPGTPEYEARIKKYPIQKASTWLDSLAEFNKKTDPVTVIPSIVKAVAVPAWEAVKSGGQTAAEGYRQIRGNQPAAGVGNVALGGLTALTSPLIGAQSAVGEQVTKLTGSPETGERAALVTGLVSPVKGSSAAAKELVRTNALNKLVEHIGPENVPAVVERLKSNPRLAPMDLSDNVRTSVQGMIDPAQPRASEAVTSAVRNRMASRLDNANHAFTEQLGPTPNAPALLNSIKEHVQKVGKESIEPVVAKAKPVDVSPVIEAIDAKLKPGITAMLDPGTRLPLSDIDQKLVRIKSQLTDGGNQVFDAAKLHKIQSDLRAEAQGLINSASGADRNLGHQMMNMRGKLVDAIDKSAGGEYRPALKQYREAKQIDEAFDAGFDTLHNRPGRKGLEDRPDSFAQWMDNASKEEIAARQLGTRLDIDQKINGVRHGAGRGEAITTIPYNKEKLGLLFGKKEADRLAQLMDDAALEAHTNSRVIANSKTAETLAANKAMKVRDVEPFQMKGALQSLMPSAMAEIGASYAGLPPGIAGPTIFAASGGAGLLKKLGQKAGSAYDRARNLEYARAASASGNKLFPIINDLMSHPDVVRQLKKSGNATSKLSPP